MENVRTMIGALTGDIVGSRWEFGGIKTKEFSLFDSKCSTTDDSILTLAIGEAILEHKANGGNLGDFAIKWLRAFACAYPFYGYGESFIGWIEDPEHKPYNSWGNGAAMRVSFCGWAAESLKEAEMLSDAVTEVTHNHPEGMSGARVTAGAVFLAQTGATKEDIREYVQRTYRKIDFTLDEIRPSYEFDVSCQGTVPQAFECFFESISFEDSIRNAISLGGDADTLGAICGAVSGAYWGVPKGIIDATRFFMDEQCQTSFDKCERAWCK